MGDSVKLRIVREAAALYNVKGYRGVTLGELAAQLGMSKKTLYLYFKSKEEIAEAVMEQTMNAVASVIAEQEKQGSDPINTLQEIFKGIRNEIMKLSPLFLEDIQKFVPRLWEKLEAFRNRQLIFIEKLLLRAKKAGQIQDHFEPRLVTAIMLESIQSMVRPDFAVKHGVRIQEVADTLFVLFMEGLRKNGQK